jgi:hypothetical protein
VLLLKEDGNLDQAIEFSQNIAATREQVEQLTTKSTELKQELSDKQGNRMKEGIDRELSL